MVRVLFFILPLALLSSACSSGSEAAQEGQSSASESIEEVQPPVAGEAGESESMTALHDNITAIGARAEHTAETVKVAHILIAFQGAERSTATRSKEEAGELAATLLAEIEAGADFIGLMKANSDDPGPGVYGMTTGTPQADYYPRQGMAGAFGDTGWRLEVDEVGVAAFDPTKSPFGWHIIKRIE